MIPESMHGTTVGYSRHRQAGEKPCGPCATAETAARREREESKDVELIGGRWVYDRRSAVQRWHPDGKTA